MSEHDIDNRHDWEFPDTYFEALREFDVNTPEYSIVAGGVYDRLRIDHPSATEEAVDVSTYLNQGEVEEAEDLVYDVLDEEENP